MIQKTFPYSNLSALTELFSSVSGDNLTLSATLIPSDERFVDFVRNGFSRVRPIEFSPFLPAVVASVPIDLKVLNGLPPNHRLVLQYVTELMSLCDELRINPFHSLKFVDRGENYVAFSRPEIDFVDPYWVDNWYKEEDRCPFTRDLHKLSRGHGVEVASLFEGLQVKFRSPEFFPGRKFFKVTFDNFKHYMIDPVKKAVSGYVSDGYIVSEFSVSSKNPESLKSTYWCKAKTLSAFSAHNGRVNMVVPGDFDTTELEARLK